MIIFTSKVDHSLVFSFLFKCLNMVFYFGSLKVAPGTHQARIDLFFVLQTPDGSFLDVMRNGYDLLRSCGVTMPEVSQNSMSVLVRLVSCFFSRRGVSFDLACFESPFKND